MPLLVYVSVLVMKGSNVAMLQAAKELYDKVSMALWPYVGLALLLRLIYNQVTFGGPKKVAEVLIALFSYAVLIYSTPQVLSVVMNSAQNVADKIAQEPPPIADTDKVLKSEFSPSITMSFNDWIVGLSQVWAQMIMTFLESIRIFALCGLFALAPIFIFMGTILGFDLYRKIFFSVLITVALWPVFSATLSTFALAIFKTKEQASLLSKAMLLFVYSTLQGIVPFFTFQQALQPVSTGLSSLGGFVSNTGKSVGGVIGFGQGFMSGLSGETLPPVTNDSGSSQNAGGRSNQGNDPIENQTST
jgi:hypothetical protein